MDLGFSVDQRSAAFFKALEMVLRSLRFFPGLSSFWFASDYSQAFLFSPIFAPCKVAFRHFAPSSAPSPLTFIT